MMPRFDPRDLPESVPLEIRQIRHDLVVVVGAIHESGKIDETHIEALLHSLQSPCDGLPLPLVLTALLTLVASTIDQMTEGHTPWKSPYPTH